MKPYQHFYLSKMQNVAIMQSETKHPSLSDSVVELYAQGGILCFRRPLSTITTLKKRMAQGVVIMGV